MKKVRFASSPHHDARPVRAGIDLIVLHAISLPPGEFETARVEDLFLGRLVERMGKSMAAEFASLQGLRVSAHFLIDRKGGITQFVPVGHRAWHAGKSSWQGKKDCNDYSVGIEMIGDESRPFTEAQYREASRLCRILMNRYPAITRDRIVGHEDVAPGRKWDPGKQWDWDQFFRTLARIRLLNLDFV